MNLDIEAARQDFFEHYYGAAAEKIKRVREEVERSMFEPPSETAVGQLRALDTEFDAALLQVGDEEALQRRIQAMRLWVRYCALCKESEFHEKVTQDAEKGRAVELAIRQLFTDNKDFLVKNGFVTEGDLSYVANDVVNRHLRALERLAGK